jgi:LysR family carnitine catabolism transcriptional activator
MNSSLTLRQLNAFRAVARLQSFTQAATELHVSQSALTMQIGTLERQLGAQLFDRSRRKVCLTFIGENLLSIAERIVGQVEEFSSVAEELAGLDQGVVRIASLSSIASRYIVPAAKVLRSEFPGFRLQIADAVAERVIALVKSGAVDFGITSPVLDDPDLECEFLLRDRLCAYEHVSKAASPPKLSMTLAELAEKRLILPGKNGIVRKLFDAAVSQSGLAVTADYEVVYDATALSFAREGLGVAILSETIQRAMNMADLTVYRIVEPEILRTVSFVWSRKQSLSRTANALRLILINLVRREREAE